MNTPDNVDGLQLVHAKFPRYTTPAPPPKQLGTVRLEVGGIQEIKDALSKASTRIDYLEAENKKLRAENQTLQEALAHWQGVVRVAREKDSTLPDPEAVPC